jgi:multiple sugar transport system ATP-binding protein
MAEVVLEAVSKYFGATQAVADLSLTAADGAFMVLLGPTGAGKTTTLRLVAGLERPGTGCVRIAGQDVTRAPPAARDVAFVFQQYSLYPHLSVFDNLAFPLRAPARRVPEPDIRRKVEQVAALLRIEAKLPERVTRLSGGQMQRVAIGRALVRAPAAYLMDEPLSSLDAKLRAELRVELKRIQRDLGATILYVTHDQTEALTLATSIGVMEQGRLVQVGTPRQIYEDPINATVAARLGSPPINLVPRSLFPHLAAPAVATRIGARTEHARIGRAPRCRAPTGATANGTTSGRVTWVEHLGDQDHLHLRLDGTEFVTLADPDAGLAAGDEVMVALENPLFFDAAGARVCA